MEFTCYNYPNVVYKILKYVNFVSFWVIIIKWVEISHVTHVYVYPTHHVY
jgi:hypothetical protein